MEKAKKILKKFKFLILAILLIIACYIYAISVGKVYTCRINNVERVTSHGESITAILDKDNNETDMIEVLVAHSDGDTAYVTVRAKDPENNNGRVYVALTSGDEMSSMEIVYVHKSGIITAGDFFGDFTGCYVIRICIAVYVALLLADCIYKYRKSLKECLYRYENILLCGLIIFLAGNLLMFVINLIVVPRMEFYSVLGSFIGFLSSFAMLTTPLALIMAVLTTISNFKLLAKEGRTWRNTLGIILGFLLCAATVTPLFISDFLQNTRLIDVHQWTGTGRFVGMLIENTAGIIVVYFECILAGSIILGFRAARHVPAFDKDYILILGCQIRKDGTLTKLLQSRADRAIEFAAMQKKATGKGITFVPSGGKGSDEVISEGEAIGNYLRSQGIAESDILVENTSANTYENFRNSVKLINRTCVKKDPRIAFSTTNYHVFRSGFLATGQGIETEGIGSRTKSYFWVNAFIREFIATMFYERRTHLLVFAVLMIINIAVVLMTYMSNVVLS